MAKSSGRNRPADLSSLAPAPVTQEEAAMVQGGLTSSVLKKRDDVNKAVISKM